MRRVMALVSSTRAFLPALSSVEHDGALTIEQHAVLEMPAHRPSQGDALEVAAHGGERAGVVGVPDASNLLLDDGALVEIGRDVVSSRSDELHPVRVCLLV